MNKRRISLLASGLAAISFCAVPVFAQSSNNNAKAAQFLNKISEVNHTQEAMAGQTVSKAPNNLSVKTYANTVNWDDKANQEAVEKIASDDNIALTNNVPKATPHLMTMSGDQYAKAYIDAEVKEQSQALNAYRNAENEFQNDPKLEMYIKESIPMVEGHVKTAKLLQNHLNQQTAQK